MFLMEDYLSSLCWSFVIYERPILDEEAKAHFAGKCCSLATTYVLQLVMLKRQGLCTLVTRPGIVSGQFLGLCDRLTARPILDKT